MSIGLFERRDVARFVEVLLDERRRPGTIRIAAAEEEDLRLQAVTRALVDAPG